MMMPDTVPVSDENAAVHAIVLAFSADPAARWLYSNPDQYLTNFPRFVRAFAGAAFEQGSADCLEDYSGVALWLPPGIHSDEKALIELFQQTIPEPDQAGVFGVLEQMDAHHPAEPHWYLPMVGVDPAHQGKGYGSALLKHALARCDGDDKLAYLESSNPKNISLYQRHGFELLGTIQVGSSPPLFHGAKAATRITPQGIGFTGKFRISTMGLIMSVEAFLLFALAVIYCAISFGDSPGETSATRKREQSLIDRARGKRRGISKSF